MNQTILIISAIGTGLALVFGLWAWFIRMIDKESEMEETGKLRT